MCGRFTSTEDKEKITKLFPNSEVLNYAHKSYNISPSNIVNIIYENNHKQPYLISIPRNELLFFGGIWREEIRDNKKMNVVCIITKEANEKLSHIHNRMPLIMSHNEGLDFLNDNENEFLHKNKSVIEDDLDFYPVSKIVNNPKNNDENCLKEISL